MGKPDYCLFNSDRFVPCMPQEDWASWTQAVFSVLALVVAIGIALYQTRKQHRRERAAQVAAAKVVAASLGVSISMAMTVLLSIKDSCTRSLKKAEPMDMTSHRDSLEKVVLPSEAQVLLLAPVIPVGSVAMATANNYVMQLREMIDNRIQSDLGSVPKFYQLNVLMVRQWSKLGLVNLRIARDQLGFP